MKNFEELNLNEMEQINGGSPLVVGLVIGLAVSWAADGILIATTGQGGANWVADALTGNLQKDDGEGYGGSHVSSSGATHGGGSRRY